MRRRARMLVLLSIPGTLLLLLLIRYYLFPYTIGILFSTQTGLGFEQNLAARLWAERHPTINMRRVRYIFVNPSLKEGAIRKAYRKLFRQGADVIIGGAISRVGTLLQQESIRYGIPTISTTTSSQYLDKKKDPFIKLLLSTAVLGKEIGRYIKKQKSNRIAIISETMNRKFSSALATAVNNSLSRNQQKSRFVLPMPEAQWNRLRQFRPQWTLLALPAHQMLKVIRFLKKYRIPSRYAAPTWGSHKLLENIYSRETRNLHVFSHFGKTEDRHKSLVNHFKKIYPVKPHFGTSYTFLALELAFSAFKEAGTSRKGLIRFLTNKQQLPSTFNPIRINRYGDGTPKYIFMLKIHNEKLHIQNTIRISDD